MRNMSFSLTEQQIRDKTKTVTRRLGWKDLKPGDVVMACVKCMGLKKGQKVEKIHPIVVISTRWEPLWAVTREECAKEGFPEMKPSEFIAMFVEMHKCIYWPMVNRIEFAHLDGD